jgi:ribosome maturation protein SDO1
MVSVEEAVVARLETHGKRFEVLVDSEKALEFKKGEGTATITDIVAVKEIFRDSSKGERIPATELQEVFGTTDSLKCAEQIVRKGQIQLTTKQRQKMQEDKKKQVIALIARRATDPEGKPHPPVRIENAINEAGIHIDPLESAEQQVKKVIDAIKPLIPISVENVQIAVKIPASVAAKAYGVLKEFGKLSKEEWQNDGSLIAVVELPGGMQGDFYDRLNKIAHGNIETRLVKK